MGLITVPRICGLNLPHTSEFTLKDPRGHPCALCMDDSIVHRSVMWIVHVLCTWTTPLVQTVSLNIWLRLMDEPYGQARDIDFYYPIGCPLVQWLSKDIIWDLMHTFVVLPKLNLNYYIYIYIFYFYYYFFFSLGHVSQPRWLTCCDDCIFQQDRHVSFFEWLVSLCWPPFWALYIGAFPLFPLTFLTIFFLPTHPRASSSFLPSSQVFPLSF